MDKQQPESLSRKGISDASIQPDSGIIPLEVETPAPRSSLKRVAAPPPVLPGMKCAECGYDMTGLPSRRCPECGTVAARPRHVSEHSKQAVREAYRKPILMLLVGGGLLMLALFLAHGLEEAALYLLKYAIEVPIGVAVFLFCCQLWLGFDAPIHLTALRLAGIYAVVDLISVGAGFIPFVGWLIPLFVYIGLLSEMLEMELNDAVLVGFLTFVVKMAVGIGLMAAFAS